MLEQILKILSKYGYVYWNGFVGTLWISAVTVFFATIVGTLIAIARMSKLKVLNAVLKRLHRSAAGHPDSSAALLLLDLPAEVHAV